MDTEHLVMVLINIILIVASGVVLLLTVGGSSNLVLYFNSKIQVNYFKIL